MSVTTVVIIIPSRYAPTEPWSIENDIRKQKVAVVSTRNDLQTHCNAKEKIWWKALLRA